MIKGIFVILPAGVGSKSEQAQWQEALGQANIDGVAIDVCLSDVYANGVFDWTEFDKKLALAPGNMNFVAGLRAGAHMPPETLDVNGGPIPTIPINIVLKADHDPVPVDYPLGYTAQYADFMVEAVEDFVDHMASVDIVDRCVGFKCSNVMGADNEMTLVSRDGSSARYDSLYAEHGYLPSRMVDVWHQITVSIMRVAGVSLICPCFIPRLAFPWVDDNGEVSGDDSTDTVMNIVKVGAQYGDFAVLNTSLAPDTKINSWMTQARGLGADIAWQCNEGDAKNWDSNATQAALLNGVKQGGAYIEIFPRLAGFQDALTATQALLRTVS